MRRVVLTCTALLLAGCVASTPPRPRMAEAHFAPWSEESFARARTQNRIVVADVGTAWCPWCRIMERRTYADPRVRALLDEHFVVIRADADARPDLRQRFVAWGWPATAFMTPEGEIIEVLRGFRAPTAFVTILEELLARQRAGELRDARASIDVGEPAADLRAVRDRVQAQLDGYYDEANGGWGRRVKYPVAASVEQALLRVSVRGETAWSERAALTLHRTARLIDPVWGGMGQASFSPQWDRVAWDIIGWQNAEALAVFAQAGASTGDERHLDAARAIAVYADMFLSGRDGAFHASTAGYLIGDSGETVRMSQSGYMALDDEGRRARGLPPVDASVYPHVNGLFARALLELHEATGDARWLERARRALDVVEADHGREGGGYRHTPDGGGPTMLADQWAMGRAWIALWQRTGSPEALELARRTAEYAITTFRDETGAFRSGSEASGPAVVSLDDAGHVARFLLELHHATSEEGRYGEIARLALLAVSQPGRSRARHRLVGPYLMGLEAALLSVTHFTVVGQPEDQRASALHAAALSVHDPRRFLEWSEPGTRYPDADEPALYLCDDAACSDPITDPGRVAERAREWLGRSDAR